MGKRQEKRFAGLRSSQFWRSVFRTGIPDSPKSRQAVILSNVFLHMHPARISAASIRFRRTFGLGGLSLLFFIVLTATGVLLMFYYRPTTEFAHHDIQEIDYTVPFGRLIRNLHRWSAHAMILAVIAHMARVFYAGAYRPPREFNWVIGVVLLVLTFFLSFTGYLLPWDQLAYWAVTVGSNMAGATPILGHAGPFSVVGADNDVRFLLLGDTTVSQAALLRFYVLHCVIIPVALALLMAIHFYRVRKDGGVLTRD